MRKFFTTLGMAALLSVSFWGMVHAAVVEHTVAGGMDAAGELTATLTVPAGTVVTVYTWGTYSAANRFELQKQVGSPGSGVFEKLLRLDTAVANTFHTNSVTAGPNGDTYRILMTVADTGDVQASLTDRESKTRIYVEGATYVRLFDDFNDTQTTALDAGLYVTQIEADGTVFALTPAIQEGGLTGVSGTGADGTDAVCFSTIDASDVAGLVSDGPIMFEVRLQADIVTGMTSIALIDVECAGTPAPAVDIDSGTVTFATGTFQNGVGITQHGDATSLDGFVAWAAYADAERFNGGDDTTTGDEMEIGDLDAATYVTLRVETDATGDCYFYVNGSLKFAGDLCVETSARLGYHIQGDTTADGAAVWTGIIDTIEFVTSRPAS